MGGGFYYYIVADKLVTSIKRLKKFVVETLQTSLCNSQYIIL